MAVVCQETFYRGRKQQGDKEGKVTFDIVQSLNFLYIIIQDYYINIELHCVSFNLQVCCIFLRSRTACKDHRDKTRVHMPAKKFPHLKLICLLFMGPTLSFVTK
jgi:hypothetical protein